MHPESHLCYWSRGQGQCCWQGSAHPSPCSRQLSISLLWYLKGSFHRLASAITMGQQGSVNSPLPVNRSCPSSKEELPSSLLWFLSSRREGLFGLSLPPTDRLAYTLLTRGLYKNRGRITIYPSQGSGRLEHRARFEVMQTFGVRHDLRLLSTHLE